MLEESEGPSKWAIKASNSNKHIGASYGAQIEFLKAKGLRCLAVRDSNIVILPAKYAVAFPQTRTPGVL